MREISVTEIAAKYEETIADRLKRHGMYDTIIAMFEAKDMEIKRLRAEVAWHEEENHRLRAALHKIAEWDLTGTAIAALGEKE